MRVRGVWLVLLLLLSGCANITAPAPDQELHLAHHELLHGPLGPSRVTLLMHEAAGYEVADEVLDEVAEGLSGAILKPVTWQRLPYATETTSGSRWEAEHLFATAARLKTAHPHDDAFYLHAVSLPGCYTTTERPCIGGVEAADVAFIFLDDQTTHGSLPARTRLDTSYERFILLHELGHAIGLVNTPVPPLTPERIADDGCECHSTEPGSVMTGAGATVRLNPDDLHGHLVREIDEVTRGSFHNDRFTALDIADLRAYQESL